MLQSLINKWNSIEKKCINYLVKTIDNVNDRTAEGLKATKKTKKERKRERRRQKENMKKKQQQYGKTFIVDTNVQVNAIYKSVKQNYIFYLALMICIYAFNKCIHKKSNLLLSVISLFFITFYGYFVHLISHYMGTKISDLYKTYDNIFTRNKCLNWLAIKIINFGEFHARTHHDTEINKTWKNIALEFINNVVSQGGLLILLKLFLGLLDNRVILLWALFYATVHNINYNMVSPLTHQQHHMNSKTNYGIDIWDIIVGSKYDWTVIETHNHGAINLLVIGAVIVMVCNKLKI